jgi:hypothetical protein
LNQDDINHLNNPTTCNEIDVVIKSLPTKKSQGPDGFVAKFYQIIKVEFYQIIKVEFPVFQEIERQRTLSNSFYESSITNIPKAN